MSAPSSPAVRTVLQLLQARQMFIGDELRVSALRAAWAESGQNPEDFGHAISELQRLGLIRSVHGTAGPAVQLTHAGFRASTEQRPRPAPPRSAARRKPGPAGRPLASQALPRNVSPARAAARPAARKTSAPAPSPAPPAGAAASRADTNHQLAHAQVFRTRNESINDDVLRHCVLGLLQHYRLKPEGKLSYASIMRHWSEMGLTRSDLLYALDVLIRHGEVRTTMHPEETVILTKQGHTNAIGAPRDLNEGMDRWQAKKRLRLTKHLGSLPAA